MKVAGIVAEYNPFHKGHAHHIERTRAMDNGCEATHVIAIMSGNYVQRGLPAFMPKWERAKTALENGVDLVVELPLPWALSSAENFAFGAVSLLESFGVVDYLSFGSECGNTEMLEKVVRVVTSDKFSSLIKYFSSFGISYPEAQQKAIEEISGSKLAKIIETPNNTLGVEYIKALRRLGSTIKPFTIKRFGPDHGSNLPVGDIASASFIRALVKSNRVGEAAEYIPLSARALFYDVIKQGHAPADIELAERAVLAVLRRMTQQDISMIAGISEGLENRIYNAVREASSWNELCKKVKTKRYPMTRVQRVLLSAFLNIKSSFGGYALASEGCIENDDKAINLDDRHSNIPSYARILAMNDKGAELLSLIKRKKEEPASECNHLVKHIQTITRVSQVSNLLDDKGRDLFSLEALSSDMYALTLPKPFHCGSEFTRGLTK